MTTTANYRSSFSGVTTTGDNGGTALVTDLVSTETGIPYEMNLFERNHVSTQTAPLYSGTTSDRISAANSQSLANRCARMLHEGTFLGASFTNTKVKRIVITVEMDGSV